jgi:EAL domain-containing protein (putative c-di-GMP-specific phosphodiesterase class I)
MDRALVHGLPGDERVAALAKATIAVADALHVQCLAEGVETEAERVWLEGAGCTRFQGYLFDRPQGPRLFADRWLRPVSAG